jgi:hypothetical protein
MSYLKVSGAVAAAVTALALSAGAYGDTGKSPDGAPGPAGNPNQPAGQPQANGPQGPDGNQGQAGTDAPKAKSHGKSNKGQAKAHGKSGTSHGKSNAAHGNSQSQSKSHANPNVGTPRKGGREDRPAGKITICHATRSEKNPYVAITISMNGLHGHGPAEDPHHHDGSWKDIIPAPNQNAKDGGCPTTVENNTTGTTKQQGTATKSAEQARPVAATPEVAVTEPASAAETQPQQLVLGARAAGTTAPAEDESAPGASKVLGASAAGTAAPKAAVAARVADDENGSLPFTGTDLVIVLLAAAVALLGGFALRRVTAGSRS